MGATEASLHHLLGRLAVLELRVRAGVERRRRSDPDPDDGFRGLYVSDAQVDRLLAGTAQAAGPAAEAEALAQEVEARADADETAGHRLRLRALVGAFGLDALDVELLVAALGPDLDARLEKLYGYLHDDVTRRRARPGLAIELAGCSPLDAAARWRVGDGAPLVRHGLLLVEEPDRPFLSRSLRVPDRVTAHLLGDDAVESALDGALLPPAAVPTEQSRLVARAVRGGLRLAYLRGTTGFAPAGVAVAALQAVGHHPLVVDLGRFVPGEAREGARSAAREAGLRGGALVAGPVDALDPATVRALVGDGGPTVLWGSASWHHEWASSTPLVVELGPLRQEQQRALWAQALDGGAAAADLDALAAFRLGPEQVRRAADAASAQALAEDSAVTVGYLATGARSQNSAGLEQLARRVQPSIGWDDLVLPAEPLGGLRHLADRVAHRGRVLEDWRLRRGGGRGEGITALFSGDSGTGKTMAAEAITSALGLDLYVIDLSSVVNKYIGETEKNLERLFTEAEGVNGVLFFDEADALFGKRSEVSDARDRYANVEVSYLLQRMETFDGLAILATNLRANLDEAFARRLSLVVDFPEPDARQRRLLWRKLLGAVPLADDVDLDFCARSFPLTGGNIRSVAVTAAYLAAANGQVLHMPELIRAVQLEYRKLGRLCLPSEFGPWLAALQPLTERSA